jgi:hypothetical protein
MAAIEDGLRREAAELWERVFIEDIRPRIRAAVDARMRENMSAPESVTAADLAERVRACFDTLSKGLPDEHIPPLMRVAQELVLHAHTYGGKEQA